MFSIRNILVPNNSLWNVLRWASKKTSGSTRTAKKSGIKKHRGWKRQDGEWVESGTLLVTQLSLRFHPGLNVGMGRNGTLYAKIPGTVIVSCEKTDPNWEHTWIQKNYSDREHTQFYKKYYNVVPKPQPQNFKLIDQV
ncbi:hypothetical protein PPYR_14323 [Photinus pyralis]|uniref:Large ribosomal subunit protein bL27m n=1 Tax=Photinus pyralis TaxID=7054 RepID=A0A1Y1L7J6_PHOPY|nr:uncharacterized protein LOC116180255 [Photinus pyralis]KAB0792364.1 hypothetical protein PPYR_14323 [Photinus pyralis]